MTSALELSEERRLLLEKLLRKKGVATGARPTIRQRAGSGPAPLSFGQQRLWFLHQLDPATEAYNLSEAVRLRGVLDAASLERALAAVAHRHEVLRTAYATIDGEPRQIVLPPAPIPLPRACLLGLPMPRREAEAGRIASALTARPFDLARGPVLRAALLELDRDDHVLLLVLHHIATDGWSLKLLVQELTRLYDATSSGAPTLLPEPPLQYSDFAAWQRNWLQGETLESQLRYWREHLAGAPTQLALPVDRPWPAVQNMRGHRTRILVSTDTAAGLRTLAREHGVTLFMVLVNGLAAFLQRITGQDDLLLGTPSAGRSRPEIESVIGFFINTLVLRADLSGDPAASALLSRVREAVLGADAHQDLPFERLIDALELPRDLSRSPLFQVMLAFQNLPPIDERPGALAVLPFPFTTRRAQFELHFSLTDAPGGLFGSLEYRTELFDAPSAQRLVRCFETLLAGMARSPHSSVSELPLLSSAEAQQLAHEWNDTAVMIAWRREHGGLHHLIEAQVAHTPDAVAASFEGTSLSYAELDGQANRLARHLRSLSCGPETRVAVAMERSLELLVALLGTLKSGAAYVPLDPDAPRERLSFMLDDTRPTVLLTQERLRPELPETSASVVSVHPDGRESRGFAGSALDEAADDLQLAYVIYTSGSTGRPKGAMVHHAGIRNRLLWMQQAYDLGPGDTVLQKTPYSFDVSVWEFFWPLLTGARVAFARPGEHRDPAALAARVAAEMVTVLHFVPSMLQLFLDEPEIVHCRAVRRVVASGEALAPELARRFHERLTGVALENLYGPTEASVDVTFQPCPPDGRARTVPIGRPIANTRIHLMDRSGQPVLIGIAGELWIGGVNVGRGYLGRPELTAERFVPDPGAAGARLYRTGDLARHRADGAVEYLGRIDHQVKVRGVRIELGEIESVLSRHPEVREAVVAVRDDGPSRQKQLVAYVVPRPGAPFSLEALRQLAATQLPEALLPSAWVRLDALPLSPNGKVDRRLLPAPDSSRPELAEAFVPPQSPLEAALAEIWEQVLGIDRIGALDNFFALGGDSILSIQVISQARERGVELSLQQIFQYQTVQQLARVASLSTAGAERASRVGPFELISEEDRQRLPQEIEDAYPLAQLQAGMLFHGELSSDSAVYNNTVSLRVAAALDLGKLTLALQRLAARHPLLRTSFHLSGFSEPLQLVHREARIPLEVDDLQGLSAAEQEAALDRWFARERRRQFDWLIPSLLRFHVHVLGDNDFQLSWSEHHAILDGWSVAAMIAELSQDYFALLRHGDAAEEPAAPISLYRDFVAQERRTLALAEAPRFWLDELRGATVPQLPWSRATAGDVHIRALSCQIPPEVADGAKRLARTAGIPLKSVLLAVHARVLHLLSGQSDLLAGVVANGRLEEPDGERVLGLFLNSLPFRLRLEAGSWRDLAGLAFATERRIMPYRRFPLAELQRLTGGRSLFDVTFTYLHYHVMQSFSGLGEDVRTRGARSDIPTNFSLSTYFLLDPFTADLSLALDHDARKLDARQAESILGYYSRALAALADDPDAPFLDACLLTGAERKEILRTWNRTETESPGAACLDELFAAQAASTPDAEAVVLEEQRLSYRGLDERANRLARYLRRLGVGPETRVGVCLERSLELVVALYAVLKAGGAYVPLELGYPAERLAFTLRDAGIPVLLTRRSLASLIPADCPRVVDLDTPEDFAGERSTPPPPITRLDNLCYVIYTSGSTGRPKGAMNTHRAVYNRLRWMQDAFGLDAGDRVLQKTPFGFDVSVWELFWPLLHGACLVLARPEGHKEPDYLAALIVRQRITTAHFVPSMLSAFLQEPGAERCTSLRRVFSSGEALTGDLRRRFFEKLGACELHNLYGPTEAAVDVTWWACDPAQTHESVPIGRPISNIQIHVLDPSLNPVPAGIAGELHIGGVGLARGYHARPALTAETFIPSPWSEEPGARLYRTGDLARYTPDGVLEYLGRIDHQVKIRGVRIELGEIEAGLLRHPAVLEAAVILREDRLLAYVVPDSGRLEAEQAGEGPGSEQVAEWGMVFDRAYESGRTGGSPEPDFSGWISSYTGERIPEALMQEWLDATVDRIHALAPQRVLEIGCGTGLLLSRIAPSCAAYWATDISEVALRALRPRWEGSAAPEVRLFQRAADDFEGIPERAFDLVVLNSVVQYFPGVDYLLRVLEGAVRSLRDGGHLFLGDLRSLPLHRAFQSSVEIFRAPASLPLEQARWRVMARMAEDGELLLAPSLLPDLARGIPRITGARLLLKRGRGRDEMSRFRYDAVLRVGPPPAAGGAVPRRLDWRAHGLTLDGLRRLLTGERPEALSLVGVPDARLSRVLHAEGLLWSLDPAVTVGDLRKAAGDTDETAIEPEDLCALAGAAGYDVDPTWAGSGADGTFAALLRPAGSPPVWTPLAANGEGERPRWRDHANHPLKSRLHSRLVPQLRRDLQRLLPEPMIPAAFVLLDALPLSHNGKLDRRSLPVPAPETVQRTGAYVAPRTPLEERLAEIWGAVLKLDQVGVEDNLFEIGGHSLLATQIVVRIREDFQLDLSLRALSDAPTVAALAVAVDRLRGQAGQAIAFTPEQPKVSDEPVDRFAPVPLTDIQQAYWLGASGLFDLGGSGVNIYLEYEAYYSAGTVASSLETALRKLIERHEMLRTIVLPDGRQQVLREVPPFQVQVDDLGNVREDAVERHLETVRNRMRYMRSRSDRWPLFEVLVSELPAGARVHIRLDGLMMDGIGRGQLLEELLLLIREPERELPPLAVSFLDHARALQAFRTTATYERSRRYWMEQVESLPPWPRLPLSRDLEPDTVPRIVKRTPVLLSPEVWAALHRRATREGFTPTGIVTAAFAEVLRPWSDNSDFTLGIEGSYLPPTHPQIRSTVGNFATIYLLAADGAAGPFVERARRIQRRITENVEHEHFSGHAVLRELNRRRRSGDHSTVPVLFDSILELSHSSFQATAGEPFTESGEEATPPLVANIREREMMISFPQVLMLCVVLQGEDGSLTLVTQTVDELLPAGMVPELTDAYAGLLVRLAEEDAAWLEERPARPRVPRALAGEVAENPAATLPALIFQRAGERPEALALTGAETLTRRQLDERSQIWVNRLSAAGAGPGSLVALALEAVPDAVAAALAVWRLGATWMAIDPAIARQSGAHLKVDSHGVEALPSGRTEVASGEPACALFPGPAGEGVRVRHADAATTVLDLARCCRLASSDRILATAPLSSDLCLFEIFGALARGAAAVLPGSAAAEGSALAELAARAGVTVWSSAPILLEEAATWAERQPTTPLRGLRLALLHREPAPARLAARLARIWPDMRALNVWGSPEAPVAAAVGDLTAARPGTLLCAEPVGGRRLQVLDGSLSPRPAGVPGTLWLGAPGERLGSCAVRARALENCAIEVLAPVGDAPVDEAGYGTDLRRVESTLQGHPEVRHALAGWRPGERGERGKVAAWIVPRVSLGPSDEELRRDLRASLPEHLLPAAVIRLESLPRTREGRIDRAALPKIPASPPPGEDTSMSALETELTGLWEEVLGRRPAHRTDDFFDLGGDSLRAVQLLNRVRQRWGAEISGATFFAQPTVARIAEDISRRPAVAPREHRRSLGERLAGWLSELVRRREDTEGSRVQSPSYSMRLFLLLWFSQLVSGVGTGLGSFALGVWVYRQNASATQLSMFAFIATCTTLLVGPLAGVLADRWDRKRLLLLSDSGAAVMTGLMALALYTGQLRLWHVYVIVVVMVAFNALQWPAFLASLSQLVPRQHLGRMSGMNQAAAIATSIICPLLSGVLIPVIGYHGVIAIDISTFFFAFLVLLFIRLPRPSAAREGRERRSMLGDFRFGWDYLRQRPGLLSLLWIFLATSFALSIVQVLLTPLILSFGSSTNLGFVNTAAAAGVLVGSLALGIWGGPQNRVKGILLFLMLQAPILFLGALKPNVTLIAVACFVFTGLTPLIGGLSQAIWQSKVAHEVQGRVFAMRGLIGNSAGPLAFLLAGPLADRIFEPLMAPGGALAGTLGRIIGVGEGRGIGLLFMALGLFLLCVVLLSSLNPRLRKVEAELPDNSVGSEDSPRRARSA